MDASSEHGKASGEELVSEKGGANGCAGRRSRRFTGKKRVSHGRTFSAIRVAADQMFSVSISGEGIIAWFCDER